MLCCCGILGFSVLTWFSLLHAGELAHWNHMWPVIVDILLQKRILKQRCVFLVFEHIIGIKAHAENGRACNFVCCYNLFSPVKDAGSIILCSSSLSLYTAVCKAISLAVTLYTEPQARSPSVSPSPPALLSIHVFGRAPSNFFSCMLQMFLSDWQWGE